MGIRIKSTKVLHMLSFVLVNKLPDVAGTGGAAILTIQWDKGKAKMIT
jgi:hypothetical protein